MNWLGYFITILYSAYPDAVLVSTDASCGYFVAYPRPLYWSGYMVGIDVFDLRGYQYGDYAGASAVFVWGSWLAVLAGIILHCHFILQTIHIRLAPVSPHRTRQ